MAPASSRLVVPFRHPLALRLGVEQNKSLNRERLPPKSFHHRLELPFEEQNLRLRIVENERQLLGRQANVQRQQHRARLQHSVVGLKQPVAVRAEKGHPVAFFDAEAAQRAAQPPSPLGKFLVGESPAVADDPNLLWELLLCVAQTTQRRKRDVHRSACS